MINGKLSRLVKQNRKLKYVCGTKSCKARRGILQSSSIWSKTRQRIISKPLLDIAINIVTWNGRQVLKWLCVARDLWMGTLNETTDK